MVVLKKENIYLFADKPHLLSEWMQVLRKMRDVLKKIFISKNIWGWQGLEKALTAYGYQFETKDLIVFYSEYEIDESLIEMLMDFSLKIETNE